MGWKRARTGAIVVSAVLMVAGFVGFVGIVLLQADPRSDQSEQIELFIVALVAVCGGSSLLTFSLIAGLIAPIWRDSWRSRKMQDPVQGQALVVSISGASGNAVSQKYTMTCVVSGPGLAATTVEHQGMAKTSQYPMPGATLPVTVDRADPTRLKILWDQVPTGHERGLAQAQALAAQMRTGAPAGFGGLSAGSRVVVQGQVVDASGVPGLGEAISQIVIRSNPDPAGAAAAVRDLLAKSGIPGAPEPSPPSASPAQRLTELDELHAKGLLTDDEYGEQRGKIIGSI